MCGLFIYESKGVIEKILIQDERIASSHPETINTICVVSILDEGKIHIVYTGIRIGNYHKSVDNFNNDGMTKPVDEKTEIVLHAAYNKKIYMKFIQSQVYKLKDPKFHIGKKC